MISQKFCRLQHVNTKNKHSPHKNAVFPIGWPQSGSRIEGKEQRHGLATDCGILPETMSSLLSSISTDAFDCIDKYNFWSQGIDFQIYFIFSSDASCLANKVSSYVWKSSEAPVSSC